MLIALGHQQHITVKIFVHNIPGCITVVGEPADTQPLSLPYCVVHQPLVLPEQLAVKAVNVAGLGRQVLLQKILETPLADKADAGGILLFGRRQAVLLGYLPHCWFFHVTQREQGLLQLTVAYRMQKIALVLIVIQPLQESGLTIFLIAAGVVAGSDGIGPQRQGVIEEGTEFDLAVAKDVRVGCATRAVFFQEVLKHIVPVFSREIGAM